MPMEIPSAKITRIESGKIEGLRPRSVGCNASKQTHGDTAWDTIVRLHTERGTSGIGWSRVTESAASHFIGRTVESLFSLPAGTHDEAQPIDFPLWDLVGKLMGVPVYQILGGSAGSIPVYDSSIYIDDLECPNDGDAIDLILREIDAGIANGHRAFKLKVGRGFMWMDHDAGIKRDIAVIRAARHRIGRDADIMIDANNGYSLNDAKQVFNAVGDCEIFWMEEPFPENAFVIAMLRDHFVTNGLETRIGDGEGNAPASFLDLVQSGLVEIVQFDMRSYGFSRWLSLASQIEPWGALCAPHSWGSHVDAFHQAHFARGVTNFSHIECDTMIMPGIIADGFAIRNGHMHLSDSPGFGLELDDAIFQPAVLGGGFVVS